jgi:predicted Fe-Mo cluster-binding NifX family protein
MKRILVPIFQERVSPVFDSCKRLLVIDVEAGKEIERKEIYLDNLTLAERVSIIRRLGAAVVICGGISETLNQQIDDLHIELINGVAGDVNEVVWAFLCNGLDDPRFFMPGRRTTV